MFKLIKDSLTAIYLGFTFILALVVFDNYYEEVLGDLRSTGIFFIMLFASSLFGFTGLQLNRLLNYICNMLDTE